MIDIDLIILAAKAHGFTDDATTADEGESHGLHLSSDGGFDTPGRMFYWVDADGWLPWVPHLDSNQALALAVKLRLSLHIGITMTTIGGGFNIQELNKPDRFASDDPLGAARRAILRAAAKAGEAMP